MYHIYLYTELQKKRRLFKVCKKSL